METLITANAPEQNAANINIVLNKVNDSLTNLDVAKGLLLEKANQLRNHELINADSQYLGHVKVGSDILVDPETNQINVNPEVIETPLTVHNSDTTSHGDVREKLKEIPKIISAPIISGPGTVKTGIANDFTVTATAYLPDAYINRINITMPDNTVVSKSGANVVNGQAIFNLTFIGNDLEAKTFKVQAFDNFGSPSEFVTGGVIISTNSAPTLTALDLYDMPAIMEPGQTSTIIIDGGTDPDNDTLTYSLIKPDGSPFTFNPSANLHNGDTVNITLAAGAIRNTTYNFTVLADDSRFGGTTTKVFGTLVNTAPVAGSVAINGLPTLVKVGAYTCTITGAIDINVSQTIKYAISANDPAITFSKSSDLAESESFTITVGSAVVRSEDLVFTIVATDSIGTAQVTRSYPVNDLPVLTAVVAPVLDESVPGGSAINLTISGALDPNGDICTYRIGNYVALLPHMTFSKYENIAENETIVITPTKVATQTNYTLNIFVKDSNNEENPTAVDIVMTVDEIYKTSAPTINYPTAGLEIIQADSYEFLLSEYATQIDI